MVVDQIPPEVLALGGIVASGLTAYIAGKKKKAYEKMMDFEQNLRQYLKDEDIFPSPATGEIRKSVIESALKRNIDNYDGSSVPIRTVYTDETYLAPVSRYDMSDAKSSNPFQYLPYRPSLYNSDDFGESFSVLASFLWGTNTVGTVYNQSSNHVYNIIVYGDGSVEFYEPQNGESVSPKSDSKYDLDSGLIIF